MSELSATNCGCGCHNERSGGCGLGNNSCIWIILLLLCCGGNGFGGRGGCGDDSCLWIIILLFCCGGFGSNRGGNDCGCGCNDGCY